MRLLYLIPFFVVLIAGQQDSIAFLNPSPPGANSDYSLNPSFVLGSSVNIQWTPTPDTISIVIYQQTPDAKFEYIFREFLSMHHHLMGILLRDIDW